MFPSLTYEIAGKTLCPPLLRNSDVVLVSLYEVLGVLGEKRLWMNHLFMSSHPSLSHKLMCEFYEEIFRCS